MVLLTGFLFHSSYLFGGILLNQIKGGKESEGGRFGWFGDLNPASVAGQFLHRGRASK